MHAQTPPGGHAEHHPAGSPTDQGSSTTPAPPATPPPPAPTSGSSMGAMMEHMTGSVPKKPLMPRLLNAERLSEAERNALRGDAERRVETGLQVLEQGLIDFAEARRTRDEAALARAIGTLQDGARRWDMGLAVLRALSPPDTLPREAALTWFKTQMHLEPTLASPSALPWGLSWTHLGGMVILGLCAAGAIVVYLSKVRRSLRLLERLTQRKHEGTR